MDHRTTLAVQRERYQTLYGAAAPRRHSRLVGVTRHVVSLVAMLLEAVARFAMRTARRQTTVEVATDRL